MSLNYLKINIECKMSNTTYSLLSVKYLWLVWASLVFWDLSSDTWKRQITSKCLVRDSWQDSIKTSSRVCSPHIKRDMRNIQLSYDQNCIQPSPLQKNGHFFYKKKYRNTFNTFKFKLMEYYSMLEYTQNKPSFWFPMRRFWNK